MKQISPGTVTVGVLAILLGLAAAYGARQFLAEESPSVPSAKGPAMATIVVPNVNLPKYVRIREQDIEEITVPAKNVPDGAVRLKSRALFRLVKATVMAGEPVLENNLFRVGEVPMLSDQLPPGYRAVTLAVDANSALNGMIQPESSVDIALTVTNDRPEVGGLATVTLMRGVKVLATSHSRFPASEDRPGQLRNVTVAVTPEQANKLILAQRYGTLSVTLRSTLDAPMLAQDGEGHDLVNTLDLLGLSDLLPIPEEFPPTTKTVEIWRNGQREEVTFGAVEIQESLNATAVAEGREPSEIVPVSSPRPTRAKKDCPGCGSKKKPAATSGKAAGSPGGRAQPESDQVGRARVSAFGTRKSGPTPAPPIAFEPSGGGT